MNMAKLRLKLEKEIGNIHSITNQSHKQSTPFKLFYRIQMRFPTINFLAMPFEKFKSKMFHIFSSIVFNERLCG